SYLARSARHSVQFLAWLLPGFRGQTCYSSYPTVHNDNPDFLTDRVKIEVHISQFQRQKRRLSGSIIFGFDLYLPLRDTNQFSFDEGSFLETSHFTHYPHSPTRTWRNETGRE